MNPWLVRASSLVLVHVVVRTGLELVLLSAPGASAWLRPAAAVLLVLVALLWAGLDALREPEEDLAVRWLGAALVAGPVSGLVGWAVQGLLVDASGSERLGGELTGGAAFTALLVLLPAAVGLLVGGRLRPGRVVQAEPELGPARKRRASR